MSDWVEVMALIEAVEDKREKDYGFDRRPSGSIWALTNFWNNLGGDK